MMRFRATGWVVLVWLAGAILPLQAEEQPFPEAIGSGVVEEIDLAGGTMIIEGRRYRYTPYIPVQTGGVTSTIDLVAPGMVVQFRFLRLPEGPRELLEVRQMPPGVVFENH